MHWLGSTVATRILSPNWMGYPKVAAQSIHIRGVLTTTACTFGQHRMTPMPILLGVPNVRHYGQPKLFPTTRHTQKDTTTIFVGNIERGMTPDELCEKLEAFGIVRSVRIMQGASEKSRKYAFVGMNLAGAAAAYAASKGDLTYFDGTQLRIEKRKYESSEDRGESEPNR
ncbi:hypothetical protein BASA50_010890 [Batrachochytrium salamandrivorans]|uniref:RRM domain-containing protein n=1 Tax=Batrachochytrium salamandrivorans TaxID=1357716 RepID=A0ABQ8F051_9FUNG|nr:hypothetical protein BASA50_010890 [Batrachochytrium salamandrivorans]